MIVAGVVIETVPGAGPRVAALADAVARALRNAMTRLDAPRPDELVDARGA